MLHMARGPREVNTHATIAKNFRLGTERTLQLRADVFGLLNQPNYDNPEDRITRGDFAIIDDADGQRVFQLGARFTF
jgi:hypothetical protein